MIYRFSFAPDRDHTQIRLIRHSEAPLPFDQWALQAPESLLSGVDLAHRLVACDSAVDVDDVLLIKNSVIAGLSLREAASLQLPALADAVAQIQASGIITQSSYRVELDWVRSNGQSILAERTGAWLKIGREHFRLPDALFAIAEAVDSINAAPSTSPEERLKGLAALRDALPAGATEGIVEAQGLIGQMTIAIADAFSLDIEGTGVNESLIPILHLAQNDHNVPLLSQAQQRAFGQRFASVSSAQAVYSIGGQQYVVLQAPLRKALSEVRRINGESTSTKRAFMANPRVYLREVLGDDTDEIVLDSVFCETTAYADRVVGLGLWTPRVVPWIKLETTDWLGSGEGGGSGGGAPRSSSLDGIFVGDKLVPLDEEEALKLSHLVERGIANGNSIVQYKSGDDIVSIPANHHTLEALQQLEVQRLRHKNPLKPKEKLQSEVLQIKDNEDELEVEQEVHARRPAPPPNSPHCLKTSLKAHQTEGLAWLQAAWTKGVPGVLLADDMGLGKTLQGLAFLAWLRDGMKSGIIARGPLLIVAPTGLLQNWRAEHDRHLKGPGIGRCLEAFGSGLSRLKIPGPDGRPLLDRAVLSSADWVLTTYETLRDYDKDFGRVRFVAALFDEAQKIKTPGVRITDAAKAMNCDFRVALTGTPVENRLADLWCITDGLHPGLLGDLKSFSATYERDLDVERLKKLKVSLEKPFGGRPQIMLRRLKQDQLKDLRMPEERLIASPMPPLQRQAYESAIAEGKAVREPGAMLKILQNLRAISLHPASREPVADDTFIAQSARLKASFDILDEVARTGDKALLFLDDLDLQARLASIIQRRYRLAAPPAIINGSVDGSTRQARVDAFQVAADGFDIMLLSPRAGGVGLTLTRANHAIHLSRWWNPAVEDQCTGRVLRIGQLKQVYVHIPLAVLGDGVSCFDENLHKLLERKRRLMHDTLMPPDATAASDRDELFRATVAS